MDQYSIEDKLFGNASREEKHCTYVSRHQMGLLSREMYSTLNIYEEYEMQEWQFDDNFIQDFIKQTAEAALDPFQLIQLWRLCQNTCWMSLET